MLRLKYTAVLLATTLIATGTSPSGDDDLGIGDIITGNDGDSVVVEGSRETDDDPGTTPVDDAGWQPPVADAEPPPTRDEVFSRCLVVWDSYRRCFLEQEKPDEARDEEEEAATLPAITISDLARFAPDGAVVTGEPDNVGIAGLPTNFVTTASEHTVDATLFGFPVSVRFTPAAYDFSFGDGTTTTTTSGGATWADLDQAQFTPTDTSHTYGERGTYTAQADVRYTAEVDFGIGWFPISGEVTSPGAPQEIRIFEAHTALVAHTCEQAPSSPGC